MYEKSHDVAAVIVQAGWHLYTRDGEELGEVISATLGRGGTVLIPAFAVGRAQTILYHLMRLKRAGRIPHAPVFLDSPMAIDASRIFCAHPDDQKLSVDECRAACANATFTNSVDDSRAIDANRMPATALALTSSLLGAVLVAIVLLAGADLLWSRWDWFQQQKNGDGTLVFGSSGSTHFPYLLGDPRVKYEIKDNGSAIYVPREDVYELRLRFAGEGLVSDGPVGYELFDRGTLGIGPLDRHRVSVPLH